MSKRRHRTSRTPESGNEPISDSKRESKESQRESSKRRTASERGSSPTPPLKTRTSLPLSEEAARSRSHTPPHRFERPHRSRTEGSLSSRTTPEQGKVALTGSPQRRDTREPDYGARNSKSGLLGKSRSRISERQHPSVPRSRTGPEIVDWADGESSATNSIMRILYGS